MTQTLSDWLLEHGLERYAELFERNEVDFDTLRLLTEADLEQLGLAFGPRKKILALVAQEDRGQSPPRVEVEERRQVTALFCDMVGFTELSTRLDPETLRIVMRNYASACKTCVDRYDGFLLPTLGDGIVALFGFPLAHEGQVERAIRVGLDIVKAIAELPRHGDEKLTVRIGAATGVVVVMSGEQSQVVGETMNLASRLQSIAPPGTVVVNDRTRRLADGCFDFDDMGERFLKGIAEPVRVFAVRGLNEAKSRFEAALQRGLTPFVGRAAEVRKILESWKTMRQTGVGHVVALQGEAGIGKSRVVEAAREILSAHSPRTLLFQCSQLAISSAFYPIRTMFERELEFTDNESNEQKLDKLEAIFVDRLGLDYEDLKFIASLLSLSFEGRYGAISVSPKRAKDTTIRLLIDMLVAEARGQATLLLFEDAHWADPTTLELLNSLVPSLARAPALLIVTARSGFESRFLADEACTLLALSPLSPTESGALVSNIAGGRKLPPALVEQIVRRTDGVPLFVEELTKTILESGGLVVEREGYAFAEASAPLAIPETLRDSLMARLDRVAEAKEIAQIGSVIGYAFSYEILAALGLIEKAAIDAALALLNSSGLINRHGENAKATYTFSHALVQDVAYDSLLKSHRKKIHGDVARTTEKLWPQTRSVSPELLARHYAAAEEYDAAAPLWLSAARLAMSRFAVEEAILHLRAGLDAVARTPVGRARDELELSLRAVLAPALVAYHGWGHGGIGHVLEPAWRLAEALSEKRAFLPLLNTLSVHTMCIGELSASHAWADKLVEAGRSHRDDDLEIMGYRAASAVRFWQGDFEGAHQAGNRVLALYDREKHVKIANIINIDPFSGEGIYRSLYLWMLGYPDQARSAQAAMESNAHRRGHPFDLAFALTLGAHIFELLDEPHAILSRANRAELIGREYGIPLLGEVLVEVGRGIAELRLGRVETGLARLGHGLDRLKRTGHRVWIWYLQAVQANFIAGQGEIARAVDLVNESVEQIEAGEDRAHHAEVLRLQAILLLKSGAEAHAETALRKSIDIAQGQRAKSWQLRSTVTLANLLSTRGRDAEAARTLSPVLEGFSEGFETKDLTNAKALLDELAAVATKPARGSRIS